MKAVFPLIVLGALAVAGCSDTVPPYREGRAERYAPPQVQITGLDAYELNLSEDQLRGAPRRSAEGHDPSFDRDWEEHVHRYYNATPYWGGSDPMSTGR